MATVNKDFKIKNGLVVEGTTGTINGEDILTKAQVDIDYIIDQVGGSGTSANTPDTLVLRDENGDFAAGTITVNQINIGEIGNIHDDGDIVISNTNGQDVILEGEDIRLNAQDDVRINAGTGGDVVLDATTGNIRFQGPNIFAGENISYTDAERVATRGYVDDAASSAQTNANSYTDGELANYTTTANLDTTIDGYGYLKSADLTGYATEGYVDTAEADAISAAASDATTKANNAEQNAKDYADGLINDASNASDEVWSAYKTSTEIGLAQAAAEQHADDAVANLVGAAPELLNTLEELATALENNPDIIADLENVAAGKQDTLTTGNGITIDDNLIYIPTYIGSGISATPGNVEIDRAEVDTWYDEAGAASAAQTAAQTFATNAINDLDTGDIEEGSNLYFTNQRALDATSAAYDAAGAAATAEQNAKDYADALTTDDVAEGGNNLYYTDARAKDDAAALLTNATKTNIQISYSGGVLNIEAEDGVADSTTFDLAEDPAGSGTSGTWYFTNQRAVDALEAVVPNFTAIEIDSVAKQVAGTLLASTGGSYVTAYSFAKADYRSAKFLIKTAYGTHTELTEVLLTLDSSDNIAITEYATIGTNGSSMAVTADISGSDVRLRVRPVNNDSTITVVGTLLA